MFSGISQFFFERPAQLAIVLVVVEFLLICTWSWRRTVRSLRAVALGALAIPACLFLSHCVKTVHERVIEVCEALASAVEEGDVAAIAARLTENFRAGHRNRDQFLNHLRETLREVEVLEAGLSRFQFLVENEREIVVEFNAKAEIRSAELPVEHVWTRWRLKFEVADDYWRITALQSVRAPLGPDLGSGNIPIKSNEC